MLNNVGGVSSMFTRRAVPKNCEESSGKIILIPNNLISTLYLILYFSLQ
jgi:hypothetical protein